MQQNIASIWWVLGALRLAEGRDKELLKLKGKGFNMLSTAAPIESKQEAGGVVGW